MCGGEIDAKMTHETDQSRTQGDPLDTDRRKLAPWGRVFGSASSARLLASSSWTQAGRAATSAVELVALLAHKVKRVEYLEMLGEIAWPTAMAWPDVAYYASVLGGGMQYPTQQYHDAAIYLMGYMINNASDGITYGGTLRAPLGLTDLPVGFTTARGLYASADSSWGKKPLPHGGHLVMRMNAAVMWRAKALKVVADSTCEAETAQASQATKDLIYTRAVLTGIKRPVMGPSAVLGDNSPMMDLVTKEGTSQRTRYFERSTLLVKFAITV